MASGGCRGSPGVDAPPRPPGWGGGLVRPAGRRAGAWSRSSADVAQLVEHHLAKVRVAGSNPVVRSKKVQVVAQRRVAYVKVGRFVRFKRADLDAYVAEHRHEVVMG
jgi:excisionase family DNA binding protein